MVHGLAEVPSQNTPSAQHPEQVVYSIKIIRSPLSIDGTIPSSSPWEAETRLEAGIAFFFPRKKEKKIEPAQPMPLSGTIIH